MPGELELVERPPTVEEYMAFRAFRGRGISTMVMDALLAFIERTYPTGAFVGLMAAEGVAGLYERYGFERRPDDAPGMRRTL